MIINRLCNHQHLWAALRILLVTSKELCNSVLPHVQ